MSVKVPERPYPTIGEIYRELAVALGTKNRNPDVDRMARDGDYDHRLREKLLKDLFYKPLIEQTDRQFSTLLCQFVDHLITEYIRLVNTVALDAMTRNESLPLIAEHFFCRQAASFLVCVHQFFGGPNPISYCTVDDNNVMGVACLWLENNISSFPTFLSRVDKEKGKAKKDQYLRWKKGIETPKVESFPDFLKGFSNSSDKISIKIHLTVARTLQFFFQKYSQYDLPDLIKVGILKSGPFDLGLVLSKANLVAAEKFTELQPIFMSTALALRRTTPKSATSKADSWALIEECEQKLSEDDQKGITRHFLEWQKARWYVFAGQYKQALKQYEIAFEYTLYRVHGLSQERGMDLNLHEILKESMALAAKEKARPMMKRLKNQAITFGIYEHPGETDQFSQANKKSKSHIVEDWEVEQWDTIFCKYSKTPVQTTWQPA
ncbi:hypothetical protein GCM10023116_20420 [Kistimonas scapharcae]|uniref:Uncharacterized protein n=1 Tax=Kistimonas scapharcae TaxID=1036133 RepID=A0ABP8V3E4_9GAMM